MVGSTENIYLKTHTLKQHVHLSRKRCLFVYAFASCVQRCRRKIVYFLLPLHGALTGLQM
jgi:hypothetical protein